MSHELRELLGELDAYGPSDGVYRSATERARVLTGSSNRRLPNLGRVFAIGAALAGVTICIALLALAAHSRRPDERPTNATRPVTQAELDAFMNRLRPRLVQLHVDIRVARSELSIYKADPTTASGDALGIRMFHSSQAFEDDYSSLTAVTAPPALKPAWSQFKHLVQNTATVAQDMSNNLRSNDVRAARRGTHNFINQTGQPIARLKAALIRYAAAAHLRLPAWIDKLGTGT